MSKALKAAVLICVMSAALLFMFFRFAFPHAVQSAQPRLPNSSDARLLPGNQNTARPQPDGTPYSSVLFPGLTSSQIIAVSVKTPDRSFEFQLDAQGVMQVNGQAADAEICATLLSQIIELPVSPISAIPSEDAPLLSLHLSTAERSSSVHFFADGGAQTEVFIRSGPREAPQYYQTDGWRVGTLIMACEGASIQTFSPMP